MKLPKFIRWFLARFRFNLKIVCEESADKGMIDFHDYQDCEDGQPWHMIPVKCKRCGKKFLC
jgi:hypothetical protein